MLMCRRYEAWSEGDETWCAILCKACMEGDLILYSSRRLLRQAVMDRYQDIPFQSTFKRLQLGPGELNGNKTVWYSRRVSSLPGEALDLALSPCMRKADSQAPGCRVLLGRIYSNFSKVGSSAPSAGSNRASTKNGRRPGGKMLTVPQQGSTIRFRGNGDMSYEAQRTN